MSGGKRVRANQGADGQVRGTRRGISDTWASGDWNARSRLRDGVLLARFGGAPLASNVYWRDLNLIAGFVRGRDTIALFELHEEEHGEEDEHAETEELELRFDRGLHLQRMVHRARLRLLTVVARRFPLRVAGSTKARAREFRARHRERNGSRPSECEGLDRVPAEHRGCRGQ